MCSKNIYLPVGIILELGQWRVKIESIKDRGASCVVYDVVYYDVISSDRHKAYLKECLPKEIDLERTENNDLMPSSADDRRIFDKYKERFKKALAINTELRDCVETGNSSSFIINQYETNNTIYVLYAIINGKTYDQYCSEELGTTLKRCLSVAKIVSKIHKKGYLYLDLKPQNILVLPETEELISLFDFDSVIRKSDLSGNQNNQLSYTSRYASCELRRGQINKIGEWTDVYSLGMIIFEKVLNREFEATDLWNLKNIDLTVVRDKHPGIRVRIIVELQELLYKTLVPSVKTRYQSMDIV